MSRKNITFGDREMKTSDFYKNKRVTKIHEIDVDKTFVSEEEPYDTKKFIQILY